MSATSAMARPGRSATSRSAGPPTNTISRSTPTGPSSAAATATVETRLAVRVAPDHDAEVRLVTLINHGDRPRELDLTSYAEVCLNHRRADQAHPAFAKLFLETEFVPGPDALLARRRPRAADQKPIWAVHVSAADGPVEYETDRARFLGRGRTPANPAALDRGARLSGTTGPVLDPVFSLRRRIRLAPGATASVAFVTGAAETREAALALAEHFRDLAVAERVRWPSPRSETSCRSWA